MSCSISSLFMPQNSAEEYVHQIEDAWAGSVEKAGNDNIAIVSTLDRCDQQTENTSPLALAEKP